jgi:hypothetical protein
MIQAILGLAYEGFRLYVILSFLAWVMAIPHAVAHWVFLFLVLLVCLPGLIAEASQSPKARQLSRAVRRG